VPQKIRLREMIPTCKDIRESLLPMVRGSGVGCIFGALPGVGPTIGAFLSYALEKRVSKDPSRFGTGAVEGLMGPEASNNAAVQTAFVPTLSLGIPGSATMAVMLGALMIHGISPGPRLVVDHPALFWGLIASFWIGNVLLLIINIPMIGIWVRMLRIPYKYLFPLIISLICVGVFSINNSVFDVWVVLVVGLVGYLLRALDFEPAPLLIGFILGPMLEVNLRRAMLITDGNFLLIVQRPVAGTLLAGASLLIVYLAWASFRRRRQVALGPVGSEFVDR
jgi:putative tricarboxylic transport membrane protein